MNENGFVHFRTTVETPYYASLRQRIVAKGGMFNAHLHIDRSGTLDYVEEYLKGEHIDSSSAISLQTKHSLNAVVHGSSLYQPEAVSARVNAYLRAMATVGTSRADSTVDVTDDAVGLSAFDALIALRQELVGTIDFRVGAYTPLGFRDDQPRRWDLFAEAAQRADFLTGLPERDDTLRHPDHIGFSESVSRIIRLGLELGKEIHIHVDQANHPFERATEQVLDVLDTIGSTQAQSIWLIHALSPSSYDQPRFDTLVRRLIEHNVGIIICPSAALSMRQLRSIPSPTHNSIARVLEFLAAGLAVRVGSDNFFDITSPAGSIDLMSEIFVLSHALRFFDLDVLACLAAGVHLSAVERQQVINHLAVNQEEEARALRFLSDRGQLD